MRIWKNKLSFKLILGLCLILLVGLTFNAVATKTIKDNVPLLTVEEVQAFYDDYAEAWQNQDYDSIKRNSILVTGPEETEEHHQRLYSEGIYLLSAQVNYLEKITPSELKSRIEDKLSKLSNEEWVITEVPIEEVPEEVLNADVDMPRDEMVVNEERINLSKSIENQIAEEGSIYVANVTFNFTDETFVDDEQKFVFHEGRWKVYVK
jgi:hypothetical protein